MTWAIETSLDVEYAHGMAPGANIVLAVGDTDDSANIAQLESEVLPRYPDRDRVAELRRRRGRALRAIRAAAAIMDKLFLNQVRHGGTVVAASGDFGASGFTPFVGPPSPMAGYPASSPFVLSVGGTMGDPAPAGLWSNGHYGGEQAWNELLPTVVPGWRRRAAAHRASSMHAPPWQLGLTGSSMRAEPDVSYNAAFNGGVIVVLGGTARSRRRHERGRAAVGGDRRARKRGARPARQRPARHRDGAALDARARQERLPPGLPRHHGRQQHAARIGLRPTRLRAGPGYDYATGLGTPDVSRLLKDLSGHDAQGFSLDGMLQSHGGGKHGKHVQFGVGG